MAKNNRKMKKANHGKRPASQHNRRSLKKYRVRT